MPKITQIRRDKTTNRVSVYIDYRFCMSIRENVWQEMGLAENSDISCVELKQKERALWKQISKAQAIENSKQALLRIQQWFNKYLPNVEVRVIDFRLSDSSSARGYLGRNDQNISLLHKETTTEIMTLEMASTEISRGINYWVRADKIDYAQNLNSWVVLYYKYPIERLIWIKPLPAKKYKPQELIANIKPYYVSFNEKSPEVHSEQDFYKYVQNKIEQMIKKIKL